MNWLKTFLSNLYQRTVVRKSNKTSKLGWKEINAGFSILGPLIFLIYINDLPVNVSNKLILYGTTYSDDTTAVAKSKTNEE